MGVRAKSRKTFKWQLLLNLDPLVVNAIIILKLEHSDEQYKTIMALLFLSYFVRVILFWNKIPCSYDGTVSRHWFLGKFILRQNLEFSAMKNLQIENNLAIKMLLWWPFVLLLWNLLLSMKKHDHQGWDYF